MRLPAYLLGLLTLGAALPACGADPDQDLPPDAVGDETALQNTTRASTDVAAPTESPARQPVVQAAADAGAAQASTPQAADAGQVLPAPSSDPCPGCGMG